MGQINLSNSQYTEAIFYFEQAFKDSANAYLECASLLQAYALNDEHPPSLAEVKQLVPDLGTVRMGQDIVAGVYYPYELYWLGMFHEAAGNHQRAAATYQQLVDLWEWADPGNSLLTDARERLQKLTTLTELTP